jgi:hypothetical protein
MTDKSEAVACLIEVQLLGLSVSNKINLEPQAEKTACLDSFYEKNDTAVVLCTWLYYSGNRNRGNIFADTAYDTAVSGNSFLLLAQLRAFP